MASKDLIQRSNFKRLDGTFLFSSTTFAIQRARVVYAVAMKATIIYITRLLEISGLLKVVKGNKTHSNTRYIGISS